MSEPITCPHCGRINSPDRQTCKRCNNVLHAETARSNPTQVINAMSLNTRQIVQATPSENEYLVVPFVGHLKSGVFSVENAGKVSQQLQTLIDQYTSRGWNFYRIDKVNIQITPGCLASLFGASVAFVTFDQVVFWRPRD